jgi:hypothetical protein
MCRFVIFLNQKVRFQYHTKQKLYWAKKVQWTTLVQTSNAKFNRNPFAAGIYEKPLVTTWHLLHFTQRTQENWSRYHQIHELKAFNFVQVQKWISSFYSKSSSVACCFTSAPELILRIPKSDICKEVMPVHVSVHTFYLQNYWNDIKETAYEG